MQSVVLLTSSNPVIELIRFNMGKHLLTHNWSQYTCEQLSEGLLELFSFDWKRGKNIIIKLAINLIHSGADSNYKNGRIIYCALVTNFNINFIIRSDTFVKLSDTMLCNIFYRFCCQNRFITFVINISFLSL